MKLLERLEKTLDYEITKIALERVAKKWNIEHTLDKEFKVTIFENNEIKIIDYSSSCGIECDYYTFYNEESKRVCNELLKIIYKKEL